MPFSGSYKAASFGDAFQKLLNSETLKNSLSHGGPAENLLNFGINAPSRRLDVGYTNNKGNFNVNAYAGLGSKFMPDTNVGVNFRFGTPGYAPLVPDQITIEENVIAPFSRMLNEKQNVENTISPARAYAEDQTKLYMQNNPYYYRSR